MFERIYVQITTACFLRCRFCPSGAMNARHARMPLDFFESVCKQAREKTRALALHLLGDPLCVENLADYLDCAHAHGLCVELTTAGLHTERLNLAHPALRQLNFSLTSFVGNGGSVASLRDYLAPLIAICRQKPKDLFINLRFWDKENALFAPLLAILSEHFAMSALDSGRKNRTGRIRLSERVFLCPDSLFVWPSMHNPVFQHSGTCYGLRTHIGILTDGRVVPCCLDYAGALCLGSLRHSTLESILQSPRAQAMGDGFARGQLVEELCKHCGYIRRFA